MMNELRSSDMGAFKYFINNKLSLPRSKSMMNYGQYMLPKSLRPSNVDDVIVLEELDMDSYDDEDSYSSN